MDGTLQQTIERVSTKAQVLVEKYGALLKAKEEADRRIAELEREVEEQRKSIERLTAERDYLQIATTIAPNRKTVERSRAILSGLVREIDRCIADLTE